MISVSITFKDKKHLDPLFSKLLSQSFMYLEITCPAPSPIDNGSPSHSGRQAVNTEITYRCDPGYKVQGRNSSNATLTCEINGEWSSSPPVCIGK